MGRVLVKGIAYNFYGKLQGAFSHGVQQGKYKRSSCPCCMERKSGYNDVTAFLYPGK